MEKYFDILRKCPLFRNIEAENLPAMLGCLGASCKAFRKKETILAEGDPARYIGILLSGAAQIVRIDYMGNRSIVANIAPAELFGESFACAGVETMPVDVIANEDAQILFLDCRRITHACTNACDFHQQMIYNLMQVVATKNLVFHEKIEITSKRSTREKLMTYLLLQAKKHKSNCFSIPYDRQELADYLGVERSGLSAELSKLRKEGVLQNRKKQFVLLQSAD